MLSAPTGAVEQISGGADRFTFPPGQYEAMLEEVRVREIPTDDADNPYAGWANSDGVVLGLQFGSIEPLDVKQDVEIGERKFFVDITLRDGEIGIADVDISERNVEHWQIQRSARSVLNLGRATGHATEEDGQTMLPDAFLEELENGQLNGLTVGLEIGNRQESAKKFKQRRKDNPDAERRVYDFLQTFFSVS